MGDGDSKRALLRAAEQALENENYPEVMNCCKQVLKQDKSVYEAYVLLAKALQRTNHFPQAQNALNRAIALNKTALPAWLGLLELHDVAWELDKVVETCKTLQELTRASGDMENYTICIQKLASTYARSQQHEQALGAWQELLKVSDVLPSSMQLEALCGVADAEAALLELVEQQDGGNSCGPVGSNGAKYSLKERRKVLESALQRTLQQPGLHVERHSQLLLDLYLREPQESRDKEIKLQLLQHAVRMTLSQNSVSAYEVTLTFCEEDDADLLFNSLHGVEDSSKGASYVKFKLGLRFAHLYPSHGLALATIACLSHGRNTLLAGESSLVQVLPDGLWSHSERGVSLLLHSVDRKRLLCEKAVRLDDNCVNGWHLLAELQAEGGAHIYAAESLRRGLQALKFLRSRYGLHFLAKELRMRLTLGQTHLATKSYKEADLVFRFILKAAQELSGREAKGVTSAALEGRAKVALAEGDVVVAEERLEALLCLNEQSHWALAEQGWLEFQKGSLEKSLNLLERAVELCGHDSSYRRRLGLVYWETGDRAGKERAVAQFVEAARLDPREAGVFRYLGHYYRQIAGDMRRAARSYQKAITLDPEDEEAGEALCNLLEQGGQHILEAAICREASQHSPRAFWAWRRLGFIQVQAKQWPDAVTNLQHALRGYTSDGPVWEALGLAYQQLGMLTAALKAYERAVSLQSTSPIFALLQSGTILLTLASFAQAIDMFRSAVEKAPNHVVAQCGLAAALLGRARECTGSGALAWAATLLKEGSEVALHCTAKNGTVAAAWKLLGDIEVAYSQVLPYDIKEAEEGTVIPHDVGPQAVGLLPKSIAAWHQQRMAASKRARRAYLHLLHICPQQGSVYADLAIAMDLVSSLNQKRSRNSTEWTESERTVLSGLCLDAADADLWLVFGILAQHKALKQHAFIQALRVDAYHAHTWAHLGQLYLREGEQALAKQAFDRARSAEPTLSLPWAGMALVHSLSDTKKDMEEALASCLYAVHLSPVVEVQLGLARLAKQTHHLHLAQVYTAIEQAVQRAPLRVEALNLKGLICESRGSLSAAISALQMAKFLSAMSPGEKDAPSANRSMMVSLNLARVFSKAGMSGFAIQEYEKLADSGILLDEPEALRCYAVAAWQAGNRELAAAIAKQAVELNKGAAALSLYFKMMYWLLGPMPVLEEVRKADVDLFHIANFSFIALALAVAAGHQQSVSGVLSRCKLLFEHERGPQAHLLLANAKQIAPGEGQSDGGVAGSLLKALHSFPDSLSLRAKLGQELLDSTYGSKTQLAVRCCNVHLLPAGKQGVVCTSLAAAVVACSSCSGVEPSSSFSSCQSRADGAASVLRKLLRWVHMEPWNITALSNLVLALQQQGEQPKQVRRLTCMQLAVPERGNIGILLRVSASSAGVQSGDTAAALQDAKAASVLIASAECQLVASLQLARCYLATQNLPLLRMELKRARQNVKPDDLLGLLKLAELEDHIGVRREATTSSFEHATQLQPRADKKMWMALWQLGKAQALLQAGDYLSAEKAASQASTLSPDGAVFHLFHGALCMQLAKMGGYTEFSTLGTRSLIRAVQGGPLMLPIAGALLAQAEASKASTRGRTLQKWEQTLRMAWAGWPAEHRPAELYYQMGLLAEQFRDTTQDGMHAPEASSSKRSWTQRALHANPACSRYWTTLRQC